MDKATIEALVDVKTKLMAASPEKLAEFGKGLLPDLDVESSRAEVVMAIEAHLTGITKEEGAAGKFKAMAAAIDVKPKGPEPKTAAGDTSAARTAAEEIKTHLRREFKFQGTLGDGKSCIGYMSFLRQLESGQKHGYPERDLVDGVIRAIQGGSRLRGYLEGREDLQLVKLQAIIRDFYKEKSATELYQELCSIKQGERESTQEFVFRALELRQKLMFASKESATIRYDPELVQQSFRHSVSTGIREDGIRAECHQLLQSYDDDENLIEGVNDIVRRGEENKTKLSKPCRVSSLAESEESVLMKEIKSLRADLNELKTSHKHGHRYQDVSSRNDTGRSSTRRTCKKCDPGTRCSHCWTCGSSTHRQRWCPENTEGSTPRGGR